MNTKIDSNILAAALVGYEKQLEHVRQKMDQIRRALGGRASQALPAGTMARKSRISAAGRARIAAAQRKRWAEARKAQA